MYADKRWLRKKRGRNVVLTSLKNRNWLARLLRIRFVVGIIVDNELTDCVYFSDLEKAEAHFEFLLNAKITIKVGDSEFDWAIA